MISATEFAAYNRAVAKIGDRAASDVEAAVDAKLAAGSVNRFLSQLDKKDCAVFLSRYYYSMAIS